MESKVALGVSSNARSVYRNVLINRGALDWCCALHQSCENQNTDGASNICLPDLYRGTVEPVPVRILHRARGK